MDHRTVERWLQEKHFHPRKPAEKASKLDPYKEDIVSLLEKHAYTATQIGYYGTHVLFDQIRVLLNCF